MFTSRKDLFVLRVFFPASRAKRSGIFSDIFFISQLLTFDGHFFGIEQRHCCFHSH